MEDLWPRWRRKSLVVQTYTGGKDEHSDEGSIVLLLLPVILMIQWTLYTKTKTSIHPYPNICFYLADEPGEGEAAALQQL